MTPELLTEAGEALYGTRWHTEIARLVGRPQQNVSQWAAGARTIPADVWPIIEKELRTRAKIAKAVAEKIKKRC